MITASELVQLTNGGSSARPAKPPIPEEALTKTRRDIARRLKAEGLEINPPEVFKAVCSHAAALGLSTFGGFQRPKKGFILFGGVGCGKTTLVRKAFRNTRIPFLSAIRVIQEALEYPDAFLADRRLLSRRDIVLDDLGAEPQGAQRFGNPISLGDWVTWRYEVFQRYGTLTYFTTNARDGGEIKELYGARVASRIREMTEVIYYNHPDRRGSL